MSRRSSGAEAGRLAVEARGEVGRSIGEDGRGVGSPRWVTWEAGVAKAKWGVG